MSSHVPAFPRVNVLLREDGSGEVTIQGTSHLVHANDLDQARRFALGIVTMRAALLLGRPVRVSAHDPHGTWPLLVHPDGHVQAADTTPPPDSPSRPPQTIALSIDNGPPSGFGRSILLGRRPQPTTGENVEVILEIPDPTLLLSKTHARLDVDEHGAVTLTDRHSTNGSHIELAGVSRTATPGQPLLVPLQATIRAGSHTLTITRTPR